MKELISNDSPQMIRILDDVPISENVRSLAENLVNQIDRPVVFLINSDGKANYGNRNPHYQNQFWVTVKPQTKQGEFDRLVLAGLLRGVIDRKRMLYAFPTETFKETIDKYADNHRKSAIEMIDKINATASTIIAESYLEKYGIKTSNEILARLYESKISGLKEYLYLQDESSQKGSLFCWYKETEVQNILDFVNVGRRNKNYLEEIHRILEKTKPKEKRKTYLKQIDSLTAYINEVKEEITAENVEDINEQLLKVILKEFDLEADVQLKYYDLKEGEINVLQIGKAKVYSYIPDYIPNQAFLSRSMRYVREMICLIEEYAGMLDTNHVYPLVAANLIDSNYPSACSNGQKEKGYYISVMRGLFEQIKYRAENVHIAADIEKSFTYYFANDDIRESIYRYAVYFITAHEYGHIFNEDCEPDAMEQPDKEEAADAEACRLLYTLLMFQPKYHSTKIQNKFHKMQLDCVLCKMGIQLAHEFRKEKEGNV